MRLSYLFWPAAQISAWGGALFCAGFLRTLAAWHLGSSGPPCRRRQEQNLFEDVRISWGVHVSVEPHHGNTKSWSCRIAPPPPPPPPPQEFLFLLECVGFGAWGLEYLHPAAARSPAATVSIIPTSTGVLETVSRLRYLRSLTLNALNFSGLMLMSQRAEFGFLVQMIYEGPSSLKKATLSPHSEA